MAASKFKQVEQEKGRPMREILPMLYERLGNQRAVAKALGISQGTLSLWIRLCGLEIKTIVVEREPVKES